MKTLRTVLVSILIMAIVVSTAGASKESVQGAMSTLKDQVSASGSAASDGYSYVSVSVIAGDNSEATVQTGGEGNWLSTSSSIYMQTDNPVSGIADAYISAEEASSGTEASADSIFNSIFLSNFIEGTGNAEGYTCIYGLEKSC